VNNEILVEREFLEILRKTCRTMRQSRQRPEMAIPAAQWELKINERLGVLEKARELVKVNGEVSQAA
jgi:hypothetical protein